jgi:hypothetical protein
LPRAHARWLAGPPAARLSHVRKRSGSPTASCRFLPYAARKPGHLATRRQTCREPEPAPPTPPSKQTPAPALRPHPPDVQPHHPRQRARQRALLPKPSHGRVPAGQRVGGGAAAGHLGRDRGLQVGGAPYGQQLSLASLFGGGGEGEGGRGGGGEGGGGGKGRGGAWKAPKSVPRAFEPP